MTAIRLPRLLFGLLLGSALAIAFSDKAQALAITETWNNAGTDWGTATDWNPNGIPSTTTPTIFTPQLGSGLTVNNPVISGASNAAAGISINNNFQGGTYNFSGSGTVTLSSGIVDRGFGTTTFNGPTLAGAAAGNLTFNIGSDAGVTLAGTTAATTNSGAITVLGGTFTLDYTASTAAKLTGNIVNLTNGGTFSLIGNSAGTALSLGNFQAGTNNVSGLNTFSITPNGAATSIAFANTGTFSTRPGTRGAYRFTTTSGNFGDANGAKITFAGTPFLGTNGLLSNTSGGATFGYATVSDAGGIDFATYNSTNGIVRATPTISTAGSSTPAAFGASTDRVQFNPLPGATITPTAAIAPGSLRITPAGSGATLAMGTNNLTSNVLMLDGGNDFTISGTGIFANNGTRYVYVNYASTTLFMSLVVDSGANPTVFVGPGFIELTGTASQNTNTDTSRFSIAGGVVRANNTEVGFTAASTAGVISFGNGVLEIKNGTNGTGASADFTRVVGVAAGNVTWGAGSAEFGSGGFSAYGAPASVNLGGSATPSALVWNTTASFVSDGYALLFGSTKSNNTLTFYNPIGLDSGTAGAYAAREIKVTLGTGGAADKTTLAGVISGSTTTDLLKTGTGVLELTAINTYAGNTLILGGTLLATNAVSATGTGNVVVASGGTLAGTGTIAPTGTNSVTVYSGGTLAQGTATTTGTLSIVANVTLNTGSTLAWKLNNATPATSALGAGLSSSPGLQDQLAITGGTNTLTAGNITFKVVELTPTAFTYGSTYSWLVASTAATPTLGTVTFDTTSAPDFTPYIANGGSLTLDVNGTNIYLDFTAVPEPGALLGLAAFAALLLRRKI